MLTDVLAENAKSNGGKCRKTYSVKILMEMLTRDVVVQINTKCSQRRGCANLFYWYCRKTYSVKILMEMLTRDMVVQINTKCSQRRGCANLFYWY